MQGHGIRTELGRVWTTDTLYRELPLKVAYWKRKGARFVNLETATFYAVASAKGIKVVYLSVVSDTVDREKMNIQPLKHYFRWSSPLPDMPFKIWSQVMVDSADQ
jgi:purine-nucleoside phosphorylase